MSAASASEGLARRKGRERYTMVRELVQICALVVLQLMQETLIHVEGDMRVVSAPQGQEDVSMRKGTRGDGDGAARVRTGHFERGG